MSVRVDAPGPFCSKCGHHRASDMACRWSECECIADHGCQCRSHPRFLGLTRVRVNPARPVAGVPQAGSLRRGGRGVSPVVAVAALLAGASLGGLLVGPAGWGAVGSVTALSLVAWETRR